MVTHATQKNPHQKIMSSMNPPFKKKQRKHTHQLWKNTTVCRWSPSSKKCEGEHGCSYLVPGNTPTKTHTHAMTSMDASTRRERKKIKTNDKERTGHLQWSQGGGGAEVPLPNLWEGVPQKAGLRVGAYLPHVRSIFFT